MFATPLGENGRISPHVECHKLAVACHGATACPTYASAFQYSSASSTPRQSAPTSKTDPSLCRKSATDRPRRQSSRPGRGAEHNHFHSLFNTITVEGKRLQQTSTSAIAHVPVPSPCYCSQECVPPPTSPRASTSRQDTGNTPVRFRQFSLDMARPVCGDFRGGVETGSGSSVPGRSTNSSRISSTWIAIGGSVSGPTTRVSG